MDHTIAKRTYIGVSRNNLGTYKDAALTTPAAESSPDQDVRRPPREPARSNPCKLQVAPAMASGELA